MRRPFLKDVNPNEIPRTLSSLLSQIALQSSSSSEPNEGRRKINVLLFIVLTVGLENHLKSKQINVYWAVKAPPSEQ